jgi:3-deoxy-manno-octulosonate cytidylyltransferase (CMP-KDO synthetase)
MILAIIPARWASTRFPGKPLVDIGGKTMIQRVYEQVQQCPLIDKIVVATDHTGIMEHVAAFGGEALMTAADHVSGTDRCAEVARQVSAATIILNVQGDEPFVQPEQLTLLIETLSAAACPIATLGKKITDSEAIFNPNIVKIVPSQQGQALYFSRHPIPYVRGTEQAYWAEKAVFYKHIGLYAFQAEALQAISRLSPTPLEIAESLEQLRWMDYGYGIAVGITDLETIGIDTPDDLKKISHL